MIKVTEKYYIKPDTDQYTLTEIKVNNKGETVYQNLSYHTTLTKAVGACMRMVQADELSKVDMNLPEAIRVLNRLNREFSDMLFDFMGSKEEL